MRITLLVDNPRSWIMPYVDTLREKLVERGHAAVLIHDARNICEGEILFLLGCEKLVDTQVLKKNMHTIVIHESALPEGKGWSPLTWQILEGKHTIPITLFEADEKADSGAIYLQDEMSFNGTELVDELRVQQGNKTIELALRFVDEHPNHVPRAQEGNETWYPRRKPADSELDVTKSIADQFNLLRVVDNERYPAFFIYNGKKYILKIYHSE